MRCPHCQTENRSGRRFCTVCGGRLGEVCPACGFEAEAGDAYCGGCGRSLAETSASPTPDVDSAREAERRPVTVLFADLCGYTGLSQSLDPEELHTLLGRYFELLDGAVVRAGGTIDKHIGDAVMAMFGAPLAHGDDPKRALQAATDIHKVMPGLGKEFGRELSVHVGIASGEVMASPLGSSAHSPYTVIGPSVNLAARLVQYAAAGETIVDDAVMVAHGPSATFQRTDGVALKGFAGDITLWRHVPSASGVRQGQVGPLFGRRREIAQLRAALSACRTSGEGGTVYVRGEPGIGKTRLIEELRVFAPSEGFTEHRGLMLDFGAARGRDAIRDIAKGLLGLDPGATADERRAALAAASRSPWTSGAASAVLADLLDSEAPADARAIFEGMDERARQKARNDTLVELLASACSERPRLLIVEDLHWADASTLAFLTAVSRAVTGLPALLVLSSRIEGDPLGPAWRASLQGSAFLTIDLGPLPDSDAQSLAHQRTGLSGGFIARCLARAEGNPLFLEQLLHYAAEDADRLPASIHNLVLARLDRLPEADRQALRAASAIGQRFSLTMVRRLAQLPDYDGEALLSHALIRPEGDEFLFAHALIREGVYASLTRERRRALHRAIAEQVRAFDPALYAEHLDKAQDLRAARAYLDAAKWQAAALQPERAITLISRAAALASKPDDTFDIALCHGRLHIEAGRGADALACYETALAHAPSPAGRCLALIGIAQSHRFGGSIEHALEGLAAAEPIASAENLTLESAEIPYLRGCLYFYAGNLEACQWEHQAALDLAEAAGNQEWQARALSGLGDADYAKGRLRSALEKFRRCVALCDSSGLPRIAVVNWMMVGHCSLYLLDMKARAEAYATVRKLAQQLGNRYAEMMALESHSNGLIWSGRMAEATPVVEEAYQLAESIGAKRFLPCLRAYKAEIALRLGDRTAAHALSQDALRMARDDMAFYGAPICALLARTDPTKEDAHQHLAEGQALLEKGSLSHNHIHYHLNAMELGLERIDAPLALHHAGALEAYTAAEPLPFATLFIARARAVVDVWCDPQSAEARAHLERLKQTAQEAGMILDWPEPKAPHDALAPN
jgi:class 3 adenylate cyclase/tetratricopeptide (TPR) repeat protein